MMDFLLNYGMFLAKLGTIVILLLLLVLGVFYLYMRSRSGGDEHLEIKNINQKYEQMQLMLKSAILPKKDFKKSLKEVKAKHKQEEKKEPDDLDISSLSIAEDLKHVSKKTLVDGIIKPRLREILNMVKLEIQKSNFTGLTPSGVVLTGGGSLTVGMTELAKQELSMPVRIGIPQNATGLVDEISSPEYATALGLVIYGTDYQQEDIRLPVVGRVEIKGIVSRGIGFIKSLLP